MRLKAQAKMGYYPTPEDVTPIISQYLKRQREGLIRIMDPCAGMGTALRHIGDTLNAETFGIEIDSERGDRAKSVLTQCLVTDYENTRISHAAFSLLWLNPPYDWATRESEIEKCERYERTFLRDCVCYLRPKGILVYLIPQRRLDRHIARMLSYRFEQISVYRFPEQAYKGFRQLVIFGVLKNRPEQDEARAKYLKDCGEFKEGIPYLPDDPSHIYEVPLSQPMRDFLFRSRDIDPAELEEEIHRHGVFSQVREMTTPVSITEKIKPIMPLRHGHLAQILACGMINGVVWDRDKINPLLIKGITKKVVDVKVEVEGERGNTVEKTTETDRIVITINAFNRQGEMISIQ